MTATPPALARALAAREHITCQGCKRVGEWAPSFTDGGTYIDAARVAGWRVWDGESIGGQAQSVRLCPVCAGTATPGQEVALLGYEAGCHTCGLDMAEESNEDPDYVFTEADAKGWARDHRCEKDTYITKPAGVA